MVFDPVGQHERSVKSFGEIDRAQELLHLVVEATHAGTKEDVAVFVHFGVGAEKTSCGEQNQVA